MLADEFKHFVTANIRQCPVDDEKVERPGLQRLNTSQSFGEDLNLMPFTLQKCFKHFGLASTIFNNSKIHKTPKWSMNSEGIPT